MPLTIVRNDITKMNVDAIVNAANTSLQAGGGVCGAIFNAAGADKLQKACNKLAPIQAGQAVITKGFALPAKYVIHAAGPVYRGGQHNEEALLRSCYKNALNLAKENKCESIAFPLISSGIYGYPKDEALRAATGEIGKWLMKNDMDVSLVVFDKEAFTISGQLLGDVKAFIDENYVHEHSLRFGRRVDEGLSVSEAGERSASLFPAAAQQADSIGFTFDGSDEAAPAQFEADAFTDSTSSQVPNIAYSYMARPRKASKKLDNITEHLDEPFSATLLRLIEAKGKTDIEVYRRANLDRKLFSKIRTGKGYMPSKKTVIALALALELSLQETRDLLERAGFALSRSVVFDVIIEYFVTKEQYDVHEINNVLFEYDQPLLGG